jgi:hypothetical protein
MEADHFVQGFAGIRFRKSGSLGKTNSPGLDLGEHKTDPSQSWSLFQSHKSSMMMSSWTPECGKVLLMPKHG